MSGLQFTWLKRGGRTPDSSPLLMVNGLTVRVGMRRVLSAVNLEVHEGDHIRITGANGSGKSTLLNAILGVPPAKVEGGTIIFQGEDISRLSPHERASRGISYMPQKDNIFPSLTVRDNIILALGLAGLEQVAQRFPDWIGSIRLNQPAGSLSGGQKQKLAWITTVLLGAKLTLFDEPRAGMDDDRMTMLDKFAPTFIAIEH